MAYPRWLPILLGFLTAVGSLSTDMYLPAFPAIEGSFGAPAGSAQITLATFFAGLAVGQLTQGSLADRFGRRVPLMAGTLIFMLASVGCAMAPNLAFLCVMRFAAAFGGSASMVIPRAVVRDLAEGHAAARMMARLILVMGASPIFAPTLGGLMLTMGSWRLIFWFTAAYGGVCFLLVWRLLPDTLALRGRIRLGAAGLAQRYLTIIREPMFLSYAFMGGFGMAGMFAYIGGSPAVIIQRFGFTPPEYGILFGISGAVFVLSSQISPFLLVRFGAVRLLRGGIACYAVASAVLMACALFDVGGVFGIVPPVMLSLAGMGIVMPNATVGALSRHAAQAGSASALMGTLQFCLGAASGLLVGVMSDGTARPFAALMLAGAVGMVVADLLRPKPSRVASRVVSK